MIAFVAALVVLLAVGGGRRRRAAVALAGVALLGSAVLLSLVLDCEGCMPEIGVWLGAFALTGWVAGAAVTLARRARPHRPRCSALLAGTAALLLVAGLVAYGRGSLNIVRWGCPTEAELRRVQSVEDVAVAFARADMRLEPIPLPVWLPPREPAYHGAHAFRFVGPGATAYVLVCRQRCAISRFRFGEAREVGEQKWRLGMDSGNNVPIWLTESDHRSGAQMLRALSEPLRNVHPFIEYGSRCYIG